HVTGVQTCALPILERGSLFFELKALQQVVCIHMPPIEFREQLNCFLHANLVRQGSGLQHGSDLLFELETALLRIEAAYAREATIGCPHALKNLDRRSLSGSVGSEQPEFFALFNFK